MEGDGGLDEFALPSPEEAALRYARAKRRADEAAAEMKAMAEVLERSFPDGRAELEVDGFQVVYAPASAPRKVNAADLMRDGYQLEQFGSFRPTLGGLEALAKELGWSSDEMARYVTVGEPGPSRIRVRRTYNEEEA